jgi:hypothetical protein
VERARQQARPRSRERPSAARADPEGADLRCSTRWRIRGAGAAKRIFNRSQEPLRPPRYSKRASKLSERTRPPEEGHACPAQPQAVLTSREQSRRNQLVQNSYEEIDLAGLRPALEYLCGGAHGSGYVPVSGLSGGLDCSLATAIAARQGHDIVSASAPPADARSASVERPCGFADCAFTTPGRRRPRACSSAVYTRKAHPRSYSTNVLT